MKMVLTIVQRFGKKGLVLYIKRSENKNYKRVTELS